MEISSTRNGGGAGACWASGGAVSSSVSAILARMGAIISDRRQRRRDGGTETETTEGTEVTGQHFAHGGTGARRRRTGLSGSRGCHRGPPAGLRPGEESTVG